MVADKLVNIGGKEVEWKAIIKFLNSIDLELVPTKRKKVVDINSNGSSRKKKGAKELHNLKFGINYDWPKKATRRSSSK